MVKADAYGLGIDQVAPVLANAGAQSFFVATAGEGAALRAVLGQGPEIYIFSGYMKGGQEMFAGAGLIPMLNSLEQVSRFVAERPGAAAALQLDSGMNRLGLEPADLPQLMLHLPRLAPRLVISHLACADEPLHVMNATQLAAFTAMAAGLPGCRFSLAATGGITLGPAYHFNLTRPGIGLYGGLPFAEAQPVLRLDVPVIQTRDILPGESVGYAASFTTATSRKIATISAGYADGLIRHLSRGMTVYADGIACPVAGRVSMDMITVDVTHLDHSPDQVEILGPNQTIDQLAADAGTIGHEILTSLGHRYKRTYKNA